MNGTGSDHGLIEREIVHTGPAPLFGIYREAPTYRVVMHVLQPFGELFGMADKTVPELVLPSGALCFAQPINLERRDSLDVLENAGNRQRMLRRDEGMPVVGHQHVAAKKKAKTLSRTDDRAEDDPIFRLVEQSFTPIEIGCDEEDPVRGAQSGDVRHTL